LPTSESKDLGSLPDPMSEKTETPSLTKGRARPSQLKYYIHDNADAFRFQLTGELTELDLPELNGCWRTAKTILGNRRLILDVSGLTAVDEMGNGWLALMVAGGAVCVPEAFGARKASPVEQRKSRGNVFTRLFSGFRSSRVVPAGSSTPAP